MIRGVMNNYFSFENEKGFSLVETLFAILLLSISSLGIMSSATFATGTINRTIHNATATRIALDALEEYYNVDPESLIDGYSNTETVMDGVSAYTQTVNIVVNADRSRSVTIVVEGVTEKAGGYVTLSNTFALQGSR